MGKGGKRRVAKSHGQSRQHLLRDEDLINGVRGPSGCTLRIARGVDRDAVQRLVALTGVDAEKEVLDGVSSDHPSHLIRLGIREGKEAVYESAALMLSRDGGLLNVVTGLMTVLIAADQQGRVVGVLVMHPPANVLGRFLTAGVPMPEAVVLAMAIAKVRGLAVAADVRQHGIGSALLSLGTRLYFQFGSFLIFGQLFTGRGLESFYSRRGFKVLESNEPLAIDVISGRPSSIGADDPNQRLFARWR